MPGINEVAQLAGVSTATVSRALSGNGHVSEATRQRVHAAALELDMPLHWEGEGLEEKGFTDDGRCVVEVDPGYFRLTEVETLLGDASKAREKLGWKPKVSFAELVSEMVREDLKSAQRDELVKDNGYMAYDYHE